ncbi:hypothetical protein [Stenotrophomonas sp. HMWF003]|uniref:hypothetical protein n=1 Tax=Stenotrophomonas sp. HMWF003 TaxID=2056840 RepID=UPI000FE1F1B9|nr:hypothetical protein [Stenotrophomonas sp. HMWF003]
MIMLDRRLLIAFATTAMFASGLAVAAPAKTAADTAYAAVDPFIGTGGEGHTQASEAEARALLRSDAPMTVDNAQPTLPEAAVPEDPRPA